jgi:hypothetical protein
MLSHLAILFQVVCVKKEHFVLFNDESAFTNRDFSSIDSIGIPFDDHDVILGFDTKNQTGILQGRPQLFSLVFGIQVPNKQDDFHQSSKAICSAISIIFVKEFCLSSAVVTS